MEMEISRTDRETQRKEAFQRIGITSLTAAEEDRVFDNFTSHVRVGLGLEKGSTSLLASHTLLSPIAREAFTAHVPDGQACFVVEIGGSKARAAKVTKNDVPNGDVVSIGEFTEQQMRQQTYERADTFFAEVAGVAKPLLGDKNPRHVALVWSYPGTSYEIPQGVDVISSPRLPKELIIQGIDASPVGKQLLDALGIDATGVSLAVLNDTIAVLLAGFGKIGGVIGTGFNLGVAYDGELRNLEAGGFSAVPNTALTESLDSASDQPGKYLAEKQISGRYVGQAFHDAVEKLSGESVIDWKIEEGNTLSASDISAVLAHDEEMIAERFPGISDESLATVEEVAKILITRSAQLAGTIIAALAMQLQDTEITVPIEGSFFNKTPGYRQIVEEVIARHTEDKKVTLVGVEQSGIKGAAVAALSLQESSARREIPR